MTRSGDRLAASPLWRHPRWSALLLPLLAVEVCSWFQGGSSLLFVVVALALVVVLPRLAAVTAVLGTVFLGLSGLFLSLRPTLPLSAFVGWLDTANYGTVKLQGQSIYRVVSAELAPGGGIAHETFAPTGTLQLAGTDDRLVIALTVAQALALLVVGCLLVPRLPVWAVDAELAVRARALSQRVTRLTETRNDATDTAVAELRRIERDLHDGAQARLVAVGMSLRAAEQLMPVNPEAALALVAEARETSSRALDDLRNLVRGIYPPVLADRGLADAVQALALDAPIEVETDITLRMEPPMPVAAAVYFGIAEALTNAVRHSGADTVQIGIGEADGMLRATIVDDGAGGADASQGTGLSGVERRLATFDGILAVTSPPGGPTIVVLEVPTTLIGSGLAGQGGWADIVRSSWQTRTLI